MRDYLNSFLNKESFQQFVRLGLIGGVNTVVYFALFNLGLRFLPDNSWRVVAAVTVAYILATSLSYVLNRRWTFQIREGWGSLREGGAFFLMNAIAWATTVIVVEGSDRIWGPLNDLQLNIANVSAVFFILLPKFAGYRDLVFRRSLDKDSRN